MLMGFLNTDVVVLERRCASMPPAVSNLASEHSSAGRAPLSQGSLRARAAHAFRLSHWPASSDSGQPGRWNGESRKRHEIGRCEDTDFADGQAVYGNEVPASHWSQVSSRRCAGCGCSCQFWASEGEGAIAFRAVMDLDQHVHAMRHGDGLNVLCDPVDLSLEPLQAPKLCPDSETSPMETLGDSNLVISQLAAGCQRRHYPARGLAPARPRLRRI